MTPSAAAIATMRARLTAQLPSTATITRTPLTPSTKGKVGTPAQVATGVACRAYPRARRGVGEVDAAGGIRAEIDWEVVMPYDTDVLERDRITVDTGTVLDVQAVNRGQSIQLSKRCLCVVVR